MMVKPALHSAALLLLLLLSGILTEYDDQVPLKVVVKNQIDGVAPLNYNTSVVHRGILLGALKRLMSLNSDFKFTYTENLNYGPYLESVNGLAGNSADHTYWELLVEYPNGATKRPDVGIGCYIPAINETIILNFTKW
nr:PREDICTED: transcobalamin-1-like [Paralichthys olivaceus]